MSGPGRRRLPLVIALSTALVLSLAPPHAIAAPPKGGGLELPDVDLGTTVDGGPTAIAGRKWDGRSAESVKVPDAAEPQAFEVDIPGPPVPSLTTSAPKPPAVPSPSPPSSPTALPTSGTTGSTGPSAAPAPSETPAPSDGGEP